MRSADPATRTKWFPHAMVGAVSGMVGSIIVLYAMSIGRHAERPRPTTVVSASSYPAFDAMEQEQKVMADRMVAAVVQGIKP
ncbi:hypothetical protein [Gluconacetobacter azotocaptans]|uniref:hypothetical protein n=1 Tax=Gluconacetobacter azotocaptans TaxID=142834 RepID=UPI001F042279|nr:hypothetical protein [Gluconacetobacter azotocaptans]